MSLLFPIRSRIGVGELKFGITCDAVRALQGEADETEESEDDDSVLWVYSEHRLNLEFEQLPDSVMMCITIWEEHPSFGEIQIGKSESELASQGPGILPSWVNEDGTWKEYELADEITILVDDSSVMSICVVCPLSSEGERSFPGEGASRYLGLTSASMR